MEIELNKIINEAIFEVFKDVTVIDVIADNVKTYLYEGTLLNKDSFTVQAYYDALRKQIHPDYIDEYFNVISLNNLKTKGSCAWIKYSKLSNELAYTDYLDVIKALDNDKIVVMSTNYKFRDNAQVEKGALDYDIAELIYNIELALSNIKSRDHEVLSSMKYVNELIYDTKSKNAEVLKNYSDLLKLNVNKTYKSLLIVDDDNLTRNIFKKVFEKDYKIIEAKNGAEAVEIINNHVLNIGSESTENIVGMFLDLKMPVLDGFGVLDYLNEKRLITRMPVIIISADDAKETREKVYSYAIADMIEKPFNYELISKRVNNLINLYAKSNSINELVQSQEFDLKKIIKKYTNAYLSNHELLINLVKKYYAVLLNEYNGLKQTSLDINGLNEAIKYYDLGLDLVPQKYLRQVNALTDSERKELMSYPVMGEKIISYIKDDLSLSEAKHANEFIMMRNERYDGLGFPKALKGEDIPDYVYLANIAIEYASNIINRQNVDYQNIYNLIVSKTGSKYSSSAIEIFQRAFSKMQ